MIARIIAMTIPLFIFWMIYPQLTLELNNAANCIPRNATLFDILNQGNFNNSEPPPGATDSFGGAGGNYHFGGYDGEVQHKDFVSQHALIQTNSSILNPDCEPLPESAKTLIKYAPWIFLAGWLFISWNWFRRFFGWGWDDGL